MRKLLLTSLLLAGLTAHAAPAKPIAETQASCAQQAKVWFEATYGNGAQRPADARPSKSTYRAHYSAKLKLCLTRLENQVAASGKSPAIDSVTLYEGDPKAKKSRGAVYRVGDKVTHCLVDGKKCASVEEWESLVRPLLKE